MKGSAMLRLLKLWLVYCTIVVSAQAQSLSRAERPQIEKGDWWEYETITFPSESKTASRLRVAEVTATAIRTGAAQRGNTYDLDWSLRETRRGEEITYRGDPPRPLLQFPLEVGRQWDGVAVIHYEGFDRRWQGNAHVERVESVTVPAGTFQAFVIKYEGDYATRRGNSSTHWIESIWYAPEVGRWVKRDWTSSTTYTQFGRQTERRVEQLTAYRRGNAGGGNAKGSASEQ
jgi:hypothetical protein